MFYTTLRIVTTHTEVSLTIHLMKLVKHKSTMSYILLTMTKEAVAPLEARITFDLTVADMNLL